MPAKPLHEVLARVVAWHNRHPLALRITPQQVHSIGGVALPFAADRPDPAEKSPPALQDLLSPATEAPAQAAFLPEGEAAAMLASAGATAPAAEVDPGAGPAQAPAPDDEVSAPLPAAATPLDAEAGPQTDAAPDTAPTELDADAAAAGDGPTELPPAAEATPTTIDDAPIELDLAFDGTLPPTADDSGAAAAAGDDGSESLSDTPAATGEAEAAPEPVPGPDSDPVPPQDTAPTGQFPAEDDRPAPDGQTTANEAVAAVDPETETETDTPLASRLRAARERARVADAPAGLDLAPGPVPASTDTLSAAPPAPQEALAIPAPGRGWRTWLARLRPRRASRSGAGSGQAQRLSALFDRDFMWPRTPQQVARWVQRHGSPAPLAPAYWPQRTVETEPAMQQAARRQGLPHTVTRHVMTAAIGVGDRRIRLLIDTDGHVLGPRAFDRRRIARLAGGGSGLLGVALLALALGPWRQATIGNEAATQAESAASATAAASAAVAAASAASEAGSEAGEHHADGATAEARDAGAHASAPPVASASAAAPTAAHDAHGVHAAHAAPAAGHAMPASAPAAPAPTPVAAAPQPADGGITVTQTPPPPYPVTRASGPIVAIRFRLSEAEKQAAREQVAAARAAQQDEATQGSAAGAAPAAPRAPAPGPQETAVRVSQQPATVFAVVTPPAPQRAAAEAIVAQMMSVRARLPGGGATQGDAMPLKGQWRAVWWPFATLAEAERARAMLVARGMRADIVEF